MNINFDFHKTELDQKGFTIIHSVLNATEADAINKSIETYIAASANFEKRKDDYAIRRLFDRLPVLKSKILNENIRFVIKQMAGNDYFIIKNIYFNKPAHANWFVSFHQDISVPVAEKRISAAYKGWTVKEDHFGVQPPLYILESIYTLRIPLDDCNAQNGALHVIPGSHKKGICETTNVDRMKEHETICEVPKGSVMLMRPLLLHASYKNTVALNRRVVHLELCNSALPENVAWAEKINF